MPNPNSKCSSSCGAGGDDSRVSMQSYNQSGYDRSAKLAPVMKLDKPTASFDVQPHMPVTLSPAYGSTGYDSLTGPPNSWNGSGYFSLRHAYGW